MQTGVLARALVVALSVSGVSALSVASPEVEVATTESAPVLRVTGEGEVELEPDRVTLGLGVVAQGETAVEAQAAASGAMSRVLTAVRGVGPVGLLIQTSQISVSPRYDSSRNREGAPRIVGYEASQRVTVRLDEISKAGEVLDAATRAGANQNFGVTFGLQNPSAAEDEALSKAVEDARRRAGVIAKAMGRELGGVVYAESVTSGGGFVPQRGMAMAAESMRGGAPEVEGGRVRVTARVDVIYGIKE